MKLTAREIVLGLVTVSVLLFGVSSLMVKSRIAVWKDLLAQQEAVVKEIDRSKRLHGDKDRWARDYEAVKSLVNVFPADQRVDVHFMTIMDGVAAKHGVTIAKRQPGEEKQIGDMFEMPIECNDVEGSQEAITRFLFDLQASGAMMDIRQLWLKPRGGGILRGRFTLYCAYMKEPKGREKREDTRPIKRKGDRAPGGRT
jgi:hypothetical protein